MLDWRLLFNKRNRLFKLSLMSSRNLPATRHSLSLLKSRKLSCSSFGTLLRRVQGVDFAELLDDETTLTFLLDFSYKGPLYKHTSMYVDHMHQPWRTLAFIINKCLFGKTASNDRLSKSRINIIWGMFYRLKFVQIGEDFQEYGLPIPETMLTKAIKKSKSYQMFIKYSIGQIPPKKSRGKGSQGKKTIDNPEETIDVYEESDSKHARKRTISRRVVKKKVSNSADDNIILDLDIALELGISISLTEVAEEEAARQVYATHARIMTESIPEPARRKPSCISFKDMLSVSKKMSPDPSQMLKGVQSLTPKEQFSTDIMQALKESKKTSRRQPCTRGSSEGTSVSLGVPNESTVVPATSNEGTESEYTKEDDDETIEWVDTNEEEEKNDDDDNKSIDLEQIDDEETDDKFVHGEEHVQDDDEETDDEFVHGDEQVNDDEDEEMTNAEAEKSGNDDEEITDAAKADAEKTKEVKDDAKKAKLPPSSSRLSVSSGFGNQFPKLSSDTSLTAVLTIHVLVIYEPLVLTPTPKTPSVAPATILLPPPPVSTIPPVLLQTTTPIPTPPITTEATTVITVVLEIDALTAVQLRVAKLEKNVSELKKIDYSAEALASLKSQVPTVVDIILDPKLIQTPKIYLEQESEKSALEISKIKKEQTEKEKMPKNPANQSLYHALMEALIEDANAMDKGVADTVKNHKRHHQDEKDDD
ncbi:hypothetical protein Tco_0843163 [Tanacetum coccineum]|uniref:Uncharacterized protein n=1 Tax=Tanacetum coccineum TaxID=301880 RepID=A0ABQ5B5E8_9ASTR